MADDKKQLLEITVTCIPHAGFHGYRIQAEEGKQAIYVERGQRIKARVDNASLIHLLQDQNVIVLDPDPGELQEQLLLKPAEDLAKQLKVDYEIVREAPKPVTRAQVDAQKSAAAGKK